MGKLNSKSMCDIILAYNKMNCYILILMVDLYLLCYYTTLEVHIYAQEVITCNVS